MPSRQKPKILALTGGIGSGKSTVAGHFKELGAEIISADNLAREIVLPFSQASDKIRQEFGDSFFREDGTLDRSKLGKLVFSDEDKRAKLESITHPQIRSLFNDRIKELEQKRENLQLIVYEIPLLFESGRSTEEFDAVGCVYTNLDKAAERIIARDDLSEAEVNKRIKSQMSPEQKAKLSDFVIDNNKELGDVVEQVQEIYKKLTSDSK